MSLPSKLLRSVRALHAPVRGEATDYRTVEKTFMFRCACAFRHVSCYQDRLNISPSNISGGTGSSC